MVEISRIGRMVLAVMGATIGIAYAPRIQAQSQPAGRLEFEAASVKPNRSGREGWEFPPISHGRFTAVNASLRMLIAEAYDVQRSRVTGTLAWFDTERYDIVAKGDANAANNQVKLMLRTLLADRFQLALHRENRELPVFALTVGKNGIKLHKAAEEVAVDTS